MDRMLEFFRLLFDTSGFPPRWNCGQWSDAHGWLHVLSDLAIFGAYSAIPLTLVYFLRHRRDVPFVPIFGLFAVFIIFCGLTHLIEATIFWHPWYRLSGLVKAVTAVVSWMTVIALVKVIPQALTLPGLAKMNRQLREEIAERQVAQQAQLKSEERLRLATDAAELGIWIWEPGADRVSWENEWVTNILGLPAGSDTVSALRFQSEILHAEDRQGFQDTLKAAGRRPAGFEFKGRIQRPDGTVRWVELRGKPVPDAAGMPFSFIGTALDVTAREASEAALRIERGRLTLALTAGEMGVYDWMIPQNMLWWSPEAYLLFGVDPKRFVPSIENFRSLVHPDDREELWRSLDDSIVNRTGFVFEFRIMRPDGTVRWMGNRAEFSYDASGQAVRHFGVVIDITPQKEAEATLRQNAQLFSAIIEHAPGGVYVVDPELCVQSFNAEAAPLFASVDQVEGKKLADVMEILWGKELSAGMVEVFRRTLETGEKFKSPRFTATRLDSGLEQVYDWETQRIMLPDGKPGVVCYFTDITERRHQETVLQNAKDEAEAANRSKDHFLAVLSHELRTPLTPVLMAVSALEHDPSVGEELRGDLRMIKRNVELETKLIDDLLDLSRITSGKVELKIERVDLLEVVREVCAICDAAITGGNVSLAVEVDPGDYPVNADPARLHQVLWNVLRNAIKFTPATGQIHIKLSQPEPGHCQVQVRDTGIGIPAGMLPRVFNAFEQGDASITRQFGGLGLGLAISRALVEMQGGEIRAESPGRGHGATFTLELPLAEPAAAPCQNRDPKPAAGLRPGIRVLLVEDHADTLRTLSRLLRNRGLEVVTAANVAQAIAAAGGGSFDVLVSDWGLPDGSGSDVIQGVHRHCRIPGVAMSGYGMEEDRQRTAAAGFSEHLTKPISIDRLVDAITKLTQDLPAGGP